MVWHLKPHGSDALRCLFIRSGWWQCVAKWHPPLTPPRILAERNISKCSMGSNFEPQTLRFIVQRPSWSQFSKPVLMWPSNSLHRVHNYELISNLKVTSRTLVMKSNLFEQRWVLPKDDHKKRPRKTLKRKAIGSDNGSPSTVTLVSRNSLPTDMSEYVP